MITTLLAVALAAAGPALPPEGARATVTVAHADLRLDRAADVRRLDRRIARAAEAVCGTASDADLAGRNAVIRCRTATIASVQSQRNVMLARAVPGGNAVAMTR